MRQFSPVARFIALHSINFYSYDIFAINIASTMLGDVYGKGRFSTFSSMFKKIYDSPGM
jgi:hypothetical protein